jgi:3-oxoacyl-(acyl-carrier-protein) synthase
VNQTRVVITGMGTISALGSSIDLLWNGLINGRSGIRRITQFDARDMPCQIAGEIPDFEVGDYMDRKEARRIPRSGQIALAAAMQAVKDAGLPETMPEPERSGVVFGTAIGGVDRIDEGIHTIRSQGYGRLNPFVLPSSIPNLSAFLIARQFQCVGANSTVTTACATGTQSIGEAMEFIRRGIVDVVITGGTWSWKAWITPCGAARISTPKSPGTLPRPTPTIWQPPTRRPPARRAPCATPSKTPGCAPMKWITSTPTAPPPR